MRNMLGDENANPSQCADGHDGFGSLLELPAGDVFGDRAIKPLAFPLTGEEVTFNATTGGEIFLLTDQFRDGAARLDRALVEIAPDRVGLIALPAILENIPGGELRVAIGGASVRSEEHTSELQSLMRI